MDIRSVRGEELGTIDDSAQSTEVPAWKMAMLSKPAISLRRGIAWDNGPAYEDTDALVLMANSSKFVDVKFPKKWNQHVSLHPNRSFRAFSGVAEINFPNFEDSEREDGVEMPYTAHCVWNHEIDTLGKVLEHKGDMFLLQNGDCMNVGTVENASTKTESYKEYWTEPLPNNNDVVLAKRPCVVAELTRSRRGLRRGRIIRIGNYCQGVEECPGPKGANVIVARWTKFTGSPERDLDEEWVEDERNMLTSVRNDHEAIFAQLLPCLWVCDDQRKLGDELENPPDTWKIVEMDR